MCVSVDVLKADQSARTI